MAEVQIVFPGLDCVATARIFLQLMRRLKLGRFVAQGGDWGAGVVSTLARLFPDALRGLHLNMMLPMRPGTQLKALLGAVAPSLVFDRTDPYQDYNIVRSVKFLFAHSGYFHVQATTPDTLGEWLKRTGDRFGMSIRTCVVNIYTPIFPVQFTKIGKRKRARDFVAQHGLILNRTCIYHTFLAFIISFISRYAN